MPTTPSRAAKGLADQLKGAGFDVTPRRVETWRARGLLGRWEHLHSGGPGSTAVPPPDAFDRARLTARLNESDRIPSTVTLLAMAFGAPIAAEDLRDSLAQLFGMALEDMGTSEVGEPADRADAYVSRLASGRRGGDAMRKRAQRLADSDDPQPSALGDRSSLERTHDALSAVLSALAGDSSWLSPILPDALRLGGMEELADLVDIGDDADSLTLRDESAEMLASMVTALANLDALSADDVAVVQAVLVESGIVTESTQSTDPISQPDVLVGQVAGVVLSQLARPGQLHDGVRAAWNLANADGDADH